MFTLYPHFGGARFLYANLSFVLFAIMLFAWHVCVCVCASMWIFCCLLAIVSIVPITLLNMPFNTISDLSRIRRNRFFPSLADNDRKRTIMNVSDDYATSVGLSIAFIRWTIVLATIHRTRTYNAEARIFCGSDNEILYLSRTEFMIAVARRFLFPFTTRLRFAPLPAAQMFIIYFGFGMANSGSMNDCVSVVRMARKIVARHGWGNLWLRRFSMSALTGQQKKKQIHANKRTVANESRNAVLEANSLAAKALQMLPKPKQQSISGRLKNVLSSDAGCFYTRETSLFSK